MRSSRHDGARWACRAAGQTRAAQPRLPPRRTCQLEDGGGGAVARVDALLVLDQRQPQHAACGWVCTARQRWRRGGGRAWLPHNSSGAGAAPLPIYPAPRRGAPVASRVALSLRRLTHRLLVLKNLCLCVCVCDVWCGRGERRGSRTQTPPRCVVLHACNHLQPTKPQPLSLQSLGSQRRVFKLVFVAVGAHCALAQPARSGGRWGL